MVLSWAGGDWGRSEHHRLKSSLPGEAKAEEERQLQAPGGEQSTHLEVKRLQQRAQQEQATGEK